MKSKVILTSITSIALVAMFCLSNMPTSAKPADSYTIVWYTIDSGGVQNLQGGSYTLSGTIGQFEAGSQSGGSYTLNGGFWVELFGYRLNLPLILR